MIGRKVVIYYAWSRPEEISAPLGVIENRFPTVFELRRMLYPRYRELADRDGVDQGVGGFLDHIMKQNFAAFVELAGAAVGQPVRELERVHDDGRQNLLDDVWLTSVDTLIVISFDSLRTGQRITDGELDAIRSFVSRPGNLLVVSLHHDVGDADHLPDEERLLIQEAHFHHHGDRTLPPQQRFSGFGRSILAGLDVPVENRFGLRPAAEPDGSPTPIEVASDYDRLHLLRGVTTFNLHPHLPHLERLGDTPEKLDVLARQRIDLTAPPHPFTESGHSTFDALLQSRPGVFPADLVVSDATLWSSTAGGVDSLSRLWRNVVLRDVST